MSVLEWHDGLNVGIGFMDADHEEAAHLINQMAEAQADVRLDLLTRFIDHCRDHFGREEDMMDKTGFFAQGCHSGEHERVLAELESVKAKLAAGQAMDDYFRTQLPNWLMNHRNSMDFVTADFAVKAGFQPV
jgi:hemerythrin